MDFRTINQTFSAEIEEKKSRFIATLVPISEFEGTLDVLRNEHRKANHHVTAFRRILDNDQIQEIGKDDGEPSGTSGMPVLKTMIGAGLMDSGLIVTRYFGGVKLGTGGLARAYSGAAKEVIQTAQLVEWVQLAQHTMTVPFDRMGDAEQIFSTQDAEVLERSYTQTGMQIRFSARKTSIESIVSLLTPNR